MAEQRMYSATPTKPNGQPDESQPKRLVKACTQAQVYQHLARNAWAVAPAGAIEVADTMLAGAKPETAGEPVQDERQEVLPGLSG
jgi:hypothetical protein